MIQLFFRAFLLGIFLSFTAGTNSLALVGMSLIHNRRAGMHMALGFFISDAIIVSACYWAFAHLPNIEAIKTFFELAGGIVMVLVGLGLIFSKPMMISDSPQQPRIRVRNHFLTGLLLNTLNPLVYVFWIGIVGSLSVSGDIAGVKGMVFFFMVLGNVLFLDMVKVMLAAKVKPLLGSRHLVTIYRAIGVLLLGIGARALWVYFT